MIHEYNGLLPIYHFDAYRLETRRRFEDLGVADYWGGGGLCLVEWADRVRELLPADCWMITIEPTGAATRSVRFESPPPPRAHRPAGRAARVSQGGSSRFDVADAGDLGLRGDSVSAPHVGCSLVRGGALRREPSLLPHCSSTRSNSNGKSAFFPPAADSFEEAGLNSAIIESLVLKYLVNCGTAAGRRIAAELGLPFRPFPDFLRGLKNQQILAYANSASANDYVYSLTDAGRSRAKMYLEECAYVGTAPVPFDDYLDSVAEQTITAEHPREPDLRRAFSDLLIAEDTLAALGPGHQLWPGTLPLWLPRQRQDQHRRTDLRCFRTTVWIPKVILVEGQLIKLFDMANHEPVETERSVRPARRVRIRSPLGPDPPPDDRRRRRAADGRPGNSLRPRDQGE